MFTKRTETILNDYHNFLINNQELVLELEDKFLVPSELMKHILVEHLNYEEIVANFVVQEFNLVSQEQLFKDKLPNT